MSMQSGLYGSTSQMPGKKLTGVAYLLWFFFGVIGAHRFYLRRIREGLFYIFATAVAVLLTIPAHGVIRWLGIVIFGLVLLAWVIDAFKMPKLVAEANDKTAAANAPAVTPEA